MRKSILLIVVLILVSCSSSTWEYAVDYCDDKVHMTMSQVEYSVDSMPRNVLAGQTRWNMRANTPQEWCSGFWGGCLWYDYALTGQTDVLAAATATSNRMLYLAKTPVYDHDLGFLTMTTLLNGYRFSPDETIRQTYRAALLDCADSLCVLFNPAVGTLMSWPRHLNDYGGHNTIMDNMINLELLLWAYEQTGKQAFYNIALSHADTTMAYQFREDGTSYHVAVYDVESGKHMYNCTHQGIADSSVWTRGQSWAIYGYTMMYRFTHEPRYLAFAQKVTDIYLDLLHQQDTANADHVPYWDFCDPRIPAAPKDASAACVVASALIELASYVEGEKAAYYRQEAEAMMLDLTNHYKAPAESPAILAHSTGHHPAGSEIDASIIYADYYYLEALYRLIKQ